MTEILITSYPNPDLDGVACAIAYAEFLNKAGTEARASFMGELQMEAEYVLRHFDFPAPTLTDNLRHAQKLILVDTSGFNRLEEKIDPNKVIELIDHRRDQLEGKFPEAKIQIEMVGSASTLITERFIKQNVEISQDSAKLLLSAIISNTLNFRSELTTGRDRQAAQWLNQTAQLPENYWQELFAAKSDLTDNKLNQTLINDFHLFVLADKKVGITQLEMIGAKGLLTERRTEIIRTLDQLKAENRTDYIFLNIIELKEGKNYFVTNDLASQQLIRNVLNLSFVNNLAEKAGLIMRKQIVPLLKQKLES